MARFRRTVSARTAEHAEYLLSHHALPFLKDYRLDQIDYSVLSSLVSRRLQKNEEIEQARAVGLSVKDSRGRSRRSVGPRTINMTLDVVAKVLADAVKRGILQSNPARDPELRLKVRQRRGNFLEADELLALFEAASIISNHLSPDTTARADRARQLRSDGRTWKEIAGELGVATSTAFWLGNRTVSEPGPSGRRALIAALGCAGLRNSEACKLNLEDFDFARGTINVRDAKSEAGVRKVNMTPWLREELLAYKRPAPTIRRARRPSQAGQAGGGRRTPSTRRSSAQQFRPQLSSAPRVANRRCPTESRLTRSGEHSSR